MRTVEKVQQEEKSYKPFQGNLEKSVAKKRRKKK